MTKSVVSALIGIAIGSRRIDGVDVPLVSFFPEYKDLQTPERQRITLKHALSMSAGLQWNENVPYTDPQNDEIVMTRSADPLRYVLDRPVVAEPGAVWNYNGGLSQTLAAVVQRASGMSLVEYAKAQLFEPLGITDLEWVGNLAGMPSAASGLRLRPRDLAKFGSVYLRKGIWLKQQIIPAAWVEESTRRHLTFPKQVARGYGYQWWHGCFESPAGGTVEARMGLGNGGQRVYVLPASRTAVTILSGRYNAGSESDRVLREHVFPAINAGRGIECAAK